MKSTYLLIGLISLLVLGVVIYGFTVTGSPLETRARKFDDERVRDIRNLSTSIQSYYTKNGVLPKTLLELDDSSYYLSKNSKEDPETGKEYEYSIVNRTSYKLCATFATASDEKKDRYSFGDEKYDHSKGYYCFELEISSYSKKSNSTTSAQKTTTFLDKNIKSVTSNALNIQSFSTVNFPYGFFSANTNEWGLINYVNSSVTVTVKFKEPVKVREISNELTHCTAGCYTWSAEGKTKDGKSVELASKITTTSLAESKKSISLKDEISEVAITATRNAGTDNYVHWKKIGFEYE